MRGAPYGCLHFKSTCFAGGGLIFPSDSLLAGDTVEVEIHLGTPAVPADKLYGIAFKITFDPPVFDTFFAPMVDSSFLVPLSFSGSWAGASGEMIDVSKYFFREGVFEVGFSGINHTARAGRGRVASFTTVMIDNISGKDSLLVLPFNYTITEVKALDEFETSFSVNADSGTIAVVQDTIVNAIPKNIEKHITIFPIPAKDLLLIRFDNIVITEFSACNIFGQEVLRESNVSSGMQLNINGLRSGVYFIKFRTTDRLLMKRIIISK